MWEGVCLYYLLGQDGTSNRLMCSAIDPESSFLRIHSDAVAFITILSTVVSYPSPRRGYPHRFETFHGKFHGHLVVCPWPKSSPRKRRLISPEQMPLGMDPKALLKMLNARGEDWNITCDDSNTRFFWNLPGTKRLILVGFVINNQYRLHGSKDIDRVTQQTFFQLAGWAKGVEIFHCKKRSI